MNGNEFKLQLAKGLYVFELSCDYHGFWFRVIDVQADGKVQFNYFNSLDATIELGKKIKVEVLNKTK